MKVCARYLGKGEVDHRFRTGHRYRAIDAVALGFHGHTVSLLFVDLGNERAEPGGGGPLRKRSHAWYMLARGETWELRKNGTVEIRAPKKKR